MTFFLSCSCNGSQTLQCLVPTLLTLSDVEQTLCVDKRV